MKILLATMKMDIGGAETHVVELCRALISRGHAVVVTSAGGRLVGEITSAGATHITLPLDKKDPVSLLRARCVLSDLIEDEGFDIVHAHARIPAFICAPICAKYDVRFVTTAHYTFDVSPMLRSLTRWGEHTFAVSEDIARYLRRNYFIESANISIIPNGIDTVKFSRDEKLGNDMKKALGAADKKIILHVSRLDKSSCLCARALLKTAEEEARQRSDLLFVFVGDGDAFDDISSEAAKINSRVGKRVAVCVGSKTDVLPYLSAADVFVGPSRAALEAMAANLPTVVSGSQGHMGVLSRENIEYAYKTNLCSRSSPPPDADMLALDIEKILSMSKEEKSALTEIQNELLSRYTVEKMTDICEREYIRLSKIKTKAPPSAVICGYYGYGNAGDRAMLLSLTRGIRNTRPSAALCVMSAKPKKTRAEYVVGTVNRYNVFAVRRAIKQAGTLIFGGGNLLQDGTSRRSLSYYLYILKTARKLGAKTIIYANGLGPLSAGAARRVIPYLSGATYVSMRDKGSFDFCQSHGIGAALTADPAFALKGGDAPQERGGYFVVAPKKTGDKNFEALCSLIKKAREKYGLGAVVAAMYSSQDAPFCKKLAENTGALLLEDGITDYGILSTAVAGAEFVISARFHALVCACAAACPPIAVGGDKNAAFMNDIGLGHCAVRSYDEASDVIDAVMKNNAVMHASLPQAAKRMTAFAESDISAVAKILSREDT